eukprot:Hpha_TRINITY_DN16518_c0_g1::TRINITY_DN16518_c0_g1_i1::g.134171::m.134171/K02218/CSNK1, CKI; casein kinase 1
MVRGLSTAKKRVCMPRPTPPGSSAIDFACVGSAQKHFRALRRLKAGSFGAVFEGAREDSDERVAIKLEDTTAGARYLQLSFEAKLLRYLSGGTGFPQVHLFKSGSPHNALVMDLLGPDLESLLRQSPQGLPMHCVVGVVMQLLRRLQWVHKAGYTHCDIKPANICLGTGRDAGTVFLCDFGLAKKTHGKTVADAPPHPKECQKLKGTERYMSLGVHEGRALTAWDDLESAAYAFIELSTGKMPWDDLVSSRAAKKGGPSPMLRRKGREPSVLCGNLPPPFTTLLSRARRGGDSRQPPTDADHRKLVALFGPLALEQVDAAREAGDWGSLVLESALSESTTASPPSRPATSPASPPSSPPTAPSAAWPAPGLIASVAAAASAAVASLPIGHAAAASRDAQMPSLALQAGLAATVATLTSQVVGLSAEPSAPGVSNATSPQLGSLVAVLAAAATTAVASQSTHGAAPLPVDSRVTSE